MAKMQIYHTDGVFEYKSCNHCHQTLPVDEFALETRRYGKRRYICKMCDREKVATYRKKFPERCRKTRISSYQKYKKFRRSAEYIRKYHITIDDYGAMAEKQNNLCAICSKPGSGKRLCVDHDHSTGKVRGLLCDSCNQLLGKMELRPDWPLRAQEYLGRWGNS